MTQRNAVHELHGDERLAGVVADFVNGADVGVIERRSRLSFAFEAGESFGVPAKLIGHELQCDRTAKTSVFGFVNHAHATTTELLDDSIVGDGLSDQRRRFGHWATILGWAIQRVNETSSRALFD